MTNKIKTLPSKLRIASDTMKDVETVSIAVFTNTGSRNETVKNNGISHFLEHMAFKGTKTRTAKQIAEQFDDIGGKINAFTSREKTVYYVKVLKQDAEFAVEFLSDILQNSTFDQEELEKERGVILQEIAMTNDTPDDIIFDYFKETAFPDQALGRSILGPEENIKNFTQQDLIDYVSTQYNYENMAVTAAGNIESDKFDSYVEKYFNNLNQNQIQKPQAGIYQGGDFRKEKDLEQVHLLMGFNSISYKDDDYYTCQILSSILGQGMSSRLFQEVREKRGLAYSIYAFNWANADSGLFGIYSGTKDKNANELIKVVTEQLIDSTSNLSDTEIKRAISQSKANILMASESTSNRSQKLGSDILNYNEIIRRDKIVEKISSVTKSDLESLANKIFINSNTTFVATGKTKDIMNHQDIVNGFRR